MANLVENTKARFDYEILEKIEAGIELLGFEVKSLKRNQGSLDGAHIIVRGGEAYAINIFIPPYQENNTPKDYDPRRNRRLLLNKEEIAKISSDDLTIVPIAIYNKNDLIKVSVAIVRGKKKYDKRETTKKRETDREVRREMKNA
jgi:SsrA-binding protein